MDSEQLWRERKAELKKTVDPRLFEIIQKADWPVDTPDELRRLTNEFLAPTFYPSAPPPEQRSCRYNWLVLHDDGRRIAIGDYIVDVRGVHRGVLRSVGPIEFTTLGAGGDGIVTQVAHQQRPTSVVLQTYGDGCRLSVLWRRNDCAECVRELADMQDFTMPSMDAVGRVSQFEMPNFALQWLDHDYASTHSDRVKRHQHCTSAGCLIYGEEIEFTEMR